MNLKPCPFCLKTENLVVKDTIYCCQPVTAVLCKSCMSFGPQSKNKDEDEAIVKWNNRILES